MLELIINLNKLFRLKRRVSYFSYSMKERLIMWVLLLVFSLSTIAQEKGIDLNWQTNFETAKETANKDKKLILIYFTGSDWSAACKNLNKDFFYTEKFKKLADENLVLVRVDAPRRPDLISELQEHSNQELSKQYNQKVYPTVVLVNPAGEKIGMIESYNYLHDTSKHYALINNALRKR